MKANRMVWIVAISALILGTRAARASDKPGKNQKFVVNLTSPISTKDSKPGDTFTAKVLEPAEFEGCVVEGHIRKVEPAQNAEAPKSRISFDFDTLTVGGANGATYKIQAELEDVVNSKGVAKVDEEGQAIGRGNTAKRMLFGAGGAGLGSLAGGMLGGGLGSLAGGMVGGAAGYVVSLDVTASSHNIEFYPGTHFTLSVTNKGVDKNVDAAAVQQQEAAAEAAMAAHANAGSAPGAPSPAPAAQPAASAATEPAPSPSPGPSPQK